MMDSYKICALECETKVILSVRGYEQDGIEEFIEDDETGFVGQLNRNSCGYDALLANLEGDGMTSFEDQKDEQKTWHLVGSYGDCTPEEALNYYAGAGVGVECIEVDLRALFEIF